MFLTTNLLNKICAAIHFNSVLQPILQQVAAKPTKTHTMQVGPSIYDSPSSPDGYYSCGLGNLCQCALCITPKPVIYQPIPTAEVQQTQPTRKMTATHGRPTFSNPNNRRSTIKRFSTAKARQVTGRSLLFQDLLP